MTSLIRGWIIGCALLLPECPLAAQTNRAEVATKVHAVLKVHCARCHGNDGQAKGGFSFVLDRDRLIAREKIVPGKPAESALYQALAEGKMPPSSQKTRPAPDDVALIRRWIDEGAAPFDLAGHERTLLGHAEVVEYAATDLESIESRNRRFMRYLTLAPLYSAGLTEEELHAARQAVAKLINSLSWHARITRPIAVDPAATLFRIDLRDYKWTARMWDHLVAEYPYRVPFASPSGRRLVTRTGCETPLIRADWFIATAARPPLYHDLLQLPSTDRSLERLLQVDLLADIQDETVVRAGFNDSGVSRNNRLIERHDAAYGAYWRSYDFSDNLGRQNLFEHPLGPMPGQNSFVAAGGEIIFHLPNGLQGYLLVDAAGRRVDRAPVQIVSDPKRPDRAVENGLSCMSCHARGLIHKADQIRAHVEKNRNAFGQTDNDTVRALYRPEKELKALLEEDSNRFVKALAKTGIAASDPEPISAATGRYEATLDARMVAAEIGITAEEFAKRLRRSPGLSRLLGSLQTRGGTVQRQVFKRRFPKS